MVQCKRILSIYIKGDQIIADELELREGEVVEKEFKSDYWEKTLCFYSQKRGKYSLTNQRIIFRGGFATTLEIPYSDIESLKLCNVGGFIPFIPTGIKVTTKTGKTHTLSVTKRKDIFAFLQSKIS